MKKQMLIGVGLASVLVLAGCETTQPQPQEVVSYSSTTYQGNQPIKQVDYAVRPDSHNMNQAEQRYLLQNKPRVEEASASAVQPQPAAQPQQAPVVETTQVETAPQKPVQQAKQEVKAEQPAPIIVKQRPRQERIKITGVGYGAQSTYEGFTDGQKRLMAIRASKLDAYRSLAEQLYGIKIDSNTSVATMTAQSDSFRARVNAVVKGARIVSITPMSDNNYETVLEVFVDRRFFEDVFVYSGNQQDVVLEPMETCTLGFNCYEAANYR
ncbi:LPP20 family lipoprotein [Thiomicrospira sp.]|uniref:LPP20 family lipoprotein n=1 Tax=Thiomicrospira sp. TaxID=935 RepID=UPI002F9381D9